MRHDRLYLEDILEAIERIEKYTAADPELVERDELIQSWVLRHLQIIGEAARSLSDELKARHPEVPWRNIGRFRNRLVHQYFDVDLPIVRHVITTEVPALKRQVVAILAGMPPEP